jgi:HlyD family secretion protein
MGKMTTRRRGMLVGIAILCVAAIVYILKFHHSANQGVLQTVPVMRGSVSTTVSATGMLEPRTTVEVKSNVGGQLMYLAVDEGDRVTAGQVIAKIDPSDAQSTFTQSQADYESAQSKVAQAQQTLLIQQAQFPTQVRTAEAAVLAARLKLAEAEKQARVQPQLTATAIDQAQSNLAAAQSGYTQTQAASVPQKLAAAQTALDQAKANLSYAEKDLQRQRQLRTKGFVAQSVLDTAEQNAAVATAQCANAQNKLDTIDAETREDLTTARAKVTEAQAALKSAQTNSIQDDLKRDDVAVARAELAQAEASLTNARANSGQTAVKQGDIIQAVATVKHSEAVVKNARTQLGYTTITAPCSGVVVSKNVEVGTVVTGAQSMGAASGATLLEIADVSHMYATVKVDETDIAQIQLGQQVHVSIDAFAGEQFTGKVSKIAPKTTTEQNITTITVTVEVAAPNLRLKPGMNATCNFVTACHTHVLMVPNAAVQRTPGGAMLTMLEHGKPLPRPVRIGLADNSNTEIADGVQEGELVVTAQPNPANASGSTTAGASGQTPKNNNSGPPPPPMF